MELRTYLSIINKRKKLIAIVFFLLFLLVVIVTLLIPPKYSSTARLRVLTPIGGGTNYLNFDIWYATRLMNTYASMASSSTIIDEVRKKFNLTSDPDISATVIADSELIRITVLDYDPVLSASIANSIAEILLANKNSSAIQAQSAADSVLSSQLDAVNQKLSDARARYRDIFIPYTQNNSKISLLTAQIQNDQNMYITIKDRIESGRQQTAISPTILAAQEAQLADLQSHIDQNTSNLETMQSKAAEDSNLINDAQSEITLIQAQYSNIVTQMDQMKSLQALQYSSEGLIVVDQAVPGRTPASPNYMLVFVLGFFISLFLAVMIAITVENLDDTYISPNQIATLNRTPFWGETSKQDTSPVNQVVGRNNPNKTTRKVSELNIDNFPNNQSLRSLVLAGVEDETSESQTWVKLALEFAQQGRKTLLIDGNMNNPSVHTHFLSTVNEWGLRDVLDGKITLAAAIKETGRKDLSVLTAGQSDGKPARTIDSEKMIRILDDLSTRFSMIVLGVTSLSSIRGNDEFISKTDGVVIVIEYGNSHKKHIRENIELVHNLNVPLLGYIIAHKDKVTLTSHIPQDGTNSKIVPDLDNI
jgi:capsular exopolysaccharide synthesis family protein